MIAFRRLAPLPLLLVGLTALAAAALVPWIVQAQSRDSGGDFTLAAANGYPTGIWSDGTNMWVADFEDSKLYAYRMSDRSRDSGKDFTLDAAIGSPVGIWSDGTTMWVSDFTDAKLYAYRMSDRSRVSGNDFDTLSGAGNLFPEGIWSDGTTMWVADTGSDTVFAYDLSTRARDLEKDVTLAPGHDSPMGVWSNGSTMWVSDWRDAKLYAYRMSDRSWDSGKDFALDADDESYEGIWSAGSTMWVASRDNGTLYAYDWNNPAAGAPTIVGAVRVDEKLAAGTHSIADADGLDDANFRYQWVSSDGNAVHGHRGRDRFDLHRRLERHGQDRQGQGFLHRPRRQRRVAYKRADGPGRGSGRLRPDAFGDGGHRRRDVRRRRLLRGFRDEARDMGRLGGLRPQRHARAAPAGEGAVGPAGRGFPRPARAARLGP